jgi:multiple sugar transport system permease protein
MTKTSMMKAIKRNAAGYAFISPFVVGFLVFTAFPIVASFFYSFTSFDMLSAPKFVGLDNYVTMFTNDPKYWKSVTVTLYYVVAVVPLRLAFALFIAMLLARASRAIGIYRTMFYLPSIIGGSVAVAIMWRNLFGDDGVINILLTLLGLDAVRWFGNPTAALWMLILLAVWQFGSSMLIFLAGLKNIPPTYYEAAAVDGANAVQKFFKITIPMLSPVILFNTIMQTISAFITFIPAFIITKGTGQPLDGTLLYSLYLFRRAFQFFQMGYGSAMAWILLIVIALLTFILFRTSRFWVHYETKEGN